MSNFYCEKCGTAILEGKDGRYFTGCEHYPADVKYNEQQTKDKLEMAKELVDRFNDRNKRKGKR